MNCSLSKAVYNALWDLYNGTNGIHWTWSTQLPTSTIWTFPSDLSTPCSDNWQGLVCFLESQNNTCSLKEIILNSYGLSGYLPSSIGNIPSLTHLELAENNLIGTIPSELRSLDALKSLYFYSNRLSGSIPSELGNLQSLEYLYFYSNNLSGQIPAELGNLGSLEYLFFHFNRISGSIPSELGSHQSILNLDLTSNYLTGVIPSELGNLQLLQYLELGINSISGTIPSELGNLQSLVYLNLYVNYLTGTVPRELGNLQSLENLDVDTNSLTGGIPAELGDLASLQYLGLFINNLNGTIPSELGNLRQIDYFYLDINCLTGTIPSELGYLQLTLHLGLYINNLSGTIPRELGNLQSLILLDFDLNSLTGPIPSELGYLQSLQYLYLYSNSLSGVIPSELGNLQVLQYLGMFDNYLSGSIPSELGYFQSLQLLDLNSNCLSGPIPSSLANLRSLQFLSLYTNRLTGTFPSDLKNLTSMELIWLHSNKLTGELRGIFDNMMKLSSIDLSENGFSGPILDELVHLGTLSYLYLDYNLFTGVIPRWQNFTLLQQLDLARNFISGEISGLTKLDALTQVFAAQNFLSGSLPESFFSSILESFDLSDNFLDGSIGQQLLGCDNLKNIALGGNSLSGIIPTYFSDLPILMSLNLSNNDLSGDISSSGFTNASLQSLDVSSNRLSGTLPSPLFDLPHLRDILLYTNCFSGSLPETMCSNSALEYLVMNDLTSNCGSGIPNALRPIFRGAVSPRLMSGSIPGCVWGMSGLRLLQLSGNGFTGSIGNLVNGSSLSSLLLSGNQLIGTIPEWIQTSSILQQLDLSQNRLQGSLMESLVISSASSLFRVSVNRLSGDLPDSLFSPSSNLTLDVLKGNQFSCSAAVGVSSWGSVLTPESLPQLDVNRDTYVCGSSFFDDYLLFALICLLLFASIVSFQRLVVGSDCELVDFKNLRQELRINNEHGWRVLFLLSMLLLVLFVSLHSSGLAQFSTHSKQYLWMTTAAFLRGWAPVLIILLAVGVGEVVVAAYGSDVNSNAANPENTILISRMEWYRRLFSYIFVHIAGIIAVIATNSAYVYATVNGLPFDQLFVIQLSLGCFKLAWNGVAIPWILSCSTKETHVTSHRSFMSLFAFIGGPLISTFFTASDCFLFVITPQPMLTSVIVVPQYSCSSDCVTFCVDGNCGFFCPSECQFQLASVATTSTPSWIYSYQCSSALLLNYVPVMIALMAISGVVLPCFVMSQFAFDRGVMLSLLTYLAPRGMLVGDAFDTVQLGRFLQIKHIVDVTTMLTFGFASPLLGMLIMLDMVVWSWVRNLLVRRQVDYIKSVKSCIDSLPTTSTPTAHDSANLSSTEQFGFSLKEPIASFEPADVLIVLSFVGVFWSLFVFDMIGDVYGDLSGGLSILAPLLLGVLTLIWLVARRRELGQVRNISRSVTPRGIELIEEINGKNPLQWSEIS